MALSKSEKELGEQWRSFWREVKANCSEPYSLMLQSMLNRIRRGNMDNAEVWLEQYLMYMDELKIEGNQYLFTQMPYLPAKPMGDYWQKALAEFGWETVQRYGAFLYCTV